MSGLSQHILVSFNVILFLLIHKYCDIINCHNQSDQRTNYFIPFN